MALLLASYFALSELSRCSHRLGFSWSRGRGGSAQLAVSAHWLSPDGRPSHRDIRDEIWSTVRCLESRKTASDRSRSKSTEMSGAKIKSSRGQIVQLLVLWICHRPEEHALVEPQQVAAARMTPVTAQAAQLVHHEGALQDRELADEAVQQRQAQRGQNVIMVSSRTPASRWRCRRIPRFRGYGAVRKACRRSRRARRSKCRG